MGRVNDDARQTSGIQNAFFQVEFPRPGLLGQEASLQSVCEAGYDTL